MDGSWRGTTKRVSRVGAMNRGARKTAGGPHPGPLPVGEGECAPAGLGGLGPVKFMERGGAGLGSLCCGDNVVRVRGGGGGRDVRIVP